MATLQTAFQLLEEQFGEFDNVKLLLSPHADDPEAVAQEILGVAQGIKGGTYTVTTDYPEPGLEGMVIAL